MLITIIFLDKTNYLFVLSQANSVVIALLSTLLPTRFLIPFPFSLFPASDVNFARPSIIQEFIEDAMLIGGHRFDVGVFVLVTSLEPLRVYTFHDWRSK